MIKILGFTGRHGVGKTTIADELQRLWGDTVAKRYSFKQPMLIAGSGALDYTLEEMTEHPAKDILDLDYGFSPRQFLDSMGQLLRELNPDILVLLAERAVKDCEEHGYKYLIIDDVMDEVEASWIRNRGGSIIHVHAHLDADFSSPPKKPPVHQGLQMWNCDFRIANLSIKEYLLDRSIPKFKQMIEETNLEYPAKPIQGLIG